MKAKIITKVDCPYCVKAKEFLEGLEIPFEQQVVGQDIEWETVQQLVPGAKTVPQIWVDDEYVGGYDNLTEWALR